MWRVLLLLRSKFKEKMKMERERKEHLLRKGYRGSQTAIRLELPIGNTINMIEAEKAIRDICDQYGWNYEAMCSGGRLYPCPNYGNLEVACASKDDGSIIGMIAMDKKSTNFLTIISELESSIDYVKPNFSSLIEISSLELRQFVAAFYEQFYEINPRRK